MIEHHSPDIQGLSCPRCGGQVVSAGEFDLYRCQYCETTIYLNATDANIIFQTAEENGSVPDGVNKPEDLTLEYERLVSKMTSIRKQLDESTGLVFSNKSFQGDQLPGWLSLLVIGLGLLILIGIFYFWIIEHQYISIALIGVSIPILVSIAFRNRQLQTQRQKLEMKLRVYEKEIIRLESNFQTSIRK